MPVEIRQIQEQDVASFRQTVDLVAGERKYLYLTEAPPIEALSAMVRETNARGSPLLVLIADSDVVGWCNVFPLPRSVQAHVGSVAMGLRPEWRGQGWGTKLMREAVGRAHAFGFTRVELTVYSDNVRAHALYTKLGFIEEGVKLRSVRIDGVEFDEIMMAHFATR